jgi:site-specific DNA-methyltransferase (adenine-specific)
MPREALSQLAWAHAHETLLWASKGKGARHTFNYNLINSTHPTSQISSLWRIPTVPMREKLHGRHPTQKPLRLVRRAIVASRCGAEGITLGEIQAIGDGNRSAAGRV